MKVTNIIRYTICCQDVLKWSRSREFFYWRLRRRLLEGSLKQKLSQFTVDKTDGQLNSMLSRWFVEDKGTVNVSKLDQEESLVVYMDTVRLEYSVHMHSTR